MDASSSFMTPFWFKCRFFCNVVGLWRRYKNIEDISYRVSQKKVGSQKISNCSNSLNFKAKINCNTIKPNVPKWRKTCTGLKFDLLDFYGPQSNIHTFWDPTFFWLTLYVYPLYSQYLSLSSLLQQLFLGTVLEFHHTSMKVEMMISWITSQW